MALEAVERVNPTQAQGDIRAASFTCPKFPQVPIYRPSGRKHSELGHLLILLKEHIPYLARGLDAHLRSIKPLQYLPVQVIGRLSFPRLKTDGNFFTLFRPRRIPITFLLA